MALLTPLAGFPAITVPAGFSRPAESARIEFLGPPSSEPQLLQITYGFVSSRSMLRLRRNIALFTSDLIARRARIYMCGLSGFRGHPPSGGSHGVSRILRSVSPCSPGVNQYFSLEVKN